MRLIGCSRNTRSLAAARLRLIFPSQGSQRAASCSSPDGHHGVAGHLQGPKHQQEAPTAPHLSIPAEKARNHAAQSGLVQRHHLHPVKNGFLYLVAIMDWATRKVLTWRLSNTLDASFCVEALEEAIAQYGKPEIMNTDQGSQYTGAGWITTLTKADIKISMDGRGRYLDNIFIERLWRSLKQEAVYLHEITDGFQAKRIIDNWIEFYNSERPHTALDKRTPDIAYFGQREIRKAA